MAKEKMVRLTLGTFELADELDHDSLMEPELDQVRGMKHYVGSPCRHCEFFGKYETTNECVGREGCLIRPAEERENIHCAALTTSAMKKPPLEKICINCGGTFYKKNMSMSVWKKRKCCTHRCHINHRYYKPKG